MRALRSDRSLFRYTGVSNAKSQDRDAGCGFHSGSTVCAGRTSNRTYFLLYTIRNIWIIDSDESGSFVADVYRVLSTILDL